MSTSVFDRNFAALKRCSPMAAEAVRSAAAREDLEFVQTPEGVVSGVISEFTLAGLVHRALASKRTPLAEAKKLTEKVDLARNAAVVVMGFGLGWHIAELARRMKHSGVLIVYEPDVSILRSVLQKIDHSEWMAQTNLLLLTGEPDEAELSGMLSPLEGLLAMGVYVLEHPPSMPRIAEQAKALSTRLGRVMQSVRTNVTTALVQTAATLKNLTQNVDHYALGAGIEDLRDSCKGHAAIVVSAGPSLGRNLRLLKQPGVTDRLVVIATQTVLKTMLREGIRPHFVCALDYHEISRRFYEGLTAEDVRGVTLVVEPKVNPAVTSAFPGNIRCAKDAWLDEVVGPSLVREMGEIPAGATVAHLCYALARHLGCDPAILIGQDLGFTDGQYYAAGAAIHDVWACELNEFNTLESLEWQRIVRHRSSLTKRTDVLGRPIYCDEQMEAYLMHFQRDFVRDVQKGLRIVDATEGGVAKLHTTTMTLKEAVARFGGEKSLPEVLRRPVTMAADASKRRDVLVTRLEGLARDIARVQVQSNDALGMLREMVKCQDDQRRVNSLIERVQAIGERVRAIEPAYSMVHRLNQTGALKRTRTDRAIYVENEADAVGVQRQQITRDIANVQSLAEAAGMLEAIMLDAVVAVKTGEKRTRDPLGATPGSQAALASGIVAAASGAVGDAESNAGDGPAIDAKKVWGVVSLRGDCNGLGIKHAGEVVRIGQRATLELTLDRLLRCKGLDGIAVVARDIAKAKSLAGKHGAGGGASPVRFIESPREPGRYDASVLRSARLPAGACWRGGIGNLTCYDELIEPGLLCDTLESAGIDAAMIVGSDWCFVDPSLCDELVNRYREDPVCHRLTFSQAGPGLCGCVLDVQLARQLNRTSTTAGVHASIGGLLSYVPVVPLADLIAKSMCVHTPPTVRDVVLRMIADDTKSVQRIVAAAEQAGLSPFTASAADLAAAVKVWASESRNRPAMPSSVTLVLSDESGRVLMEAKRAEALIAEFAATCEGMLTLRDPLMSHPSVYELAARAKQAGIACVHVRSTWAGANADAKSLCNDAGVLNADVISIDVVADSPVVHERLLPSAGPGSFQRARANMQQLLNLRRLSDGESTAASSGGGIAVPMIVPRLERRDEVYEHVEPVVDGSIMLAGWSVLDPSERGAAGARITPLPLPWLARTRRELNVLEIGSTDTAGTIAELWARACATRANGSPH